MKTSTICKNCGGEHGIHHYQTSQCPVGGREAPVGRKQEYKTSTFEPEQDNELQSLLDEKEKTIKAQAKKIAEYEEKFLEILQASIDEQGDWHGVQIPYCPAWVQSFRTIEDIAQEVVENIGEG